MSSLKIHKESLMNNMQVITPESLTPAIVKEQLCKEATEQEIFYFLLVYLFACTNIPENQT
jgi:hypothetical protein